MKSILTLAVLLAVSTTPANAETYLVCPDGSCDFPTIQEAIIAAANGDEILLADGTFTGPGNRNITFMGRSITVRSVNNNPELCIIDCEGSASAPQRGFEFAGGETNLSVLEGVSIINGYMDNGGGMVIVDASPWINNCRFTDNHSSATGASGGGGAVLGVRASPMFLDCVFETNTSVLTGGAVAFAEDCYPTFDNCQFLDNYVVIWGAAIFLWDGSGADIFGCTFLRNGQTDQFALDNRSNAQLMQIVDCTLAYNARGIHSTQHLTIENTIVAFSAGQAVEYEGMVSNLSITCTDLFGNGSGDWTGDLLPFLENEELHNLWVNPLFCMSEPSDYTLQPDSECAAENNPDCGQIGAWGITDDPESCIIGVEDVTTAMGPYQLTSHPNPFQGTTRITFTLPDAAAGDFVLGVYDVAGRLVRSLDAVGGGAGPYSSVWDGTSDAGAPVADGVYFLSFRHDGQAMMKRLVLVR